MAWDIGGCKSPTMMSTEASHSKSCALGAKKAGKTRCLASRWLIAKENTRDMVDCETITYKP